MDISKNITYYRSQKGVTQQWLADAIDVSKMSISHFENGKRRPDIATIKKICKALDVTLGKFMAYNEGVTVFNGSFRKSDNLAASQQDAIVTQIRYAAQRYYDACLCANTVCDANTLPKEKIPVFEDANRSASYMRSVLGLAPTGPVGNLTSVLENKGIYVVLVEQRDMGVSTKNFSGYNGLSNKGFPIIAVNESMVYGRQRFTLAHEFAHLLFTNATERQIDDIAGRFLLPSEDLKREVGSKRPFISFKEIVYVQNEYGVSEQCIVFRARQEEIISQRTYDIILNAKVYPQDTTDIREHPIRLEQIVCRAYTDNEISVSKAAELLNVDTVKAAAICGAEGESA